MTKKMDLKEFQDFGFLQEANRQFFHPLGLALTVYIDKDWDYTHLFIQDWRDDKEGGVFLSLNDDDSRDKAKRVENLLREFAQIRFKFFGWMIQPIGHEFQEDNLND